MKIIIYFILAMLLVGECLFMPQILDITYTLEPWFGGFTKTTLEKSVLLQYYGTITVGIGTILLALYAVYQTNKSQKMTQEANNIAAQAIKMNKRFLDLENAKSVPILEHEESSVSSIWDDYENWVKKYPRLKASLNEPVFIGNDSVFTFYNAKLKTNLKLRDMGISFANSSDRENKVCHQYSTHFVLRNKSSITIDKIFISKLSCTFFDENTCEKNRDIIIKNVIIVIYYI